MFRKKPKERDDATAKRRPRLHRSSLIIGLLTLVVMSLIVLPGARPDNWGRRFGFLAGGATPRDDPIEDFHHGWPTTFLRRRVLYRPNLAPTDPEAAYSLIDPPPAVPWLSPCAWKPWKATPDYPYDFSVTALLLDLAIALLIVGTVIVLAEWRRRRQQRFLQFRVSELLAAVTLSAIVMGWLAYHRNEHRREEAHAVALAKLPYVLELGLECSAPTWLTRLVGHDLLPSFLWHPDSVMIFGDHRIHQASGKADLCHLRDLERLESIDVFPVCLPDGRVDVPYSIFADVTSLRRLNLVYSLPRSVHSTVRPEFPMGAAEAKRLAQLQQITTLRIERRSDLTPEAWEIIRKEMPNCEVEVWNDQ